MSDTTKNIAILGSTGSIGRSALEVIDKSNGRLRAVALSAHSNLSLLVSQAKKYLPRYVIATDPSKAKRFDWSELPTQVELLTGLEVLEEVVIRPEIDTLLAAIVGSAGLKSTWAAIGAKKSIALANKETLVMAGSLVVQRAAKFGVEIIPVDSEHSALFQALKSGTTQEIRRLILTASGGPFRTWPVEQLAQVSVEDALAHPNWEMGKKISVDSATMMNKALELIEARWLFNTKSDQLEVMIHPQSIIHSFVEYVDGSVLAQLSPPDMKLPIQYALEYPHRRPGVSPKMDWKQSWNLEFNPPCLERFPALALGYRCADQGGSSGAVLNAANEAAVALFLNGELHFTEIVPACRSVLDSHNFEPNPTMDQLIAFDAWARKEVTQWVCA